MTPRYLVATSGGVITLLGVAFTLIDSNWFASVVLLVGLGMSAGGMWPEIHPGLACAASIAAPIRQWLVEYVTGICRRNSVKKAQTATPYLTQEKSFYVAPDDVGKRVSRRRLRREKRRSARWERKTVCTSVRFERKQIRPSLRFELLKRAEYRCEICGANSHTDSSVKLHVDHKIPVARGGTNDVQNLWVLCSTCNLGKGTRSL